MNLKEGIGGLDAAIRSFVGEGKHKLSDLFLVNLLIDVLEQASAVDELSAGDFPRASYANARAALESAIDASYLTSSIAEYNQRGARARAFELFAAERLQQRAGVVSQCLSGGSDDIEKAVTADAALWEDDAIEHRKVMLAEHERLLRQPPRIGAHWSGLSRQDLYRSLAGTDSEPADVVRMIDTIYGVLSQQVHPGLRTSQRVRSLDGPNKLTIAGSPDDAKHTREAASLACALALAAIQRRANF